MSTPANVHAAARRMLAVSDPIEKVAGAETLWQAWQTGQLIVGPFPEDRTLVDAGCPARPALAPPEAMPRRELGSPGGHAALIHALAHIEFNAINLALDAVYRFRELPAEFHGDWLQVAAEEALHFSMLRAHLQNLGADYGDFVAHGGLWEMARRTAHDPLARMGLVPRLLEARGLDVTPGIQRKLRSFGDVTGAAILDRILADEIGHVAIGDRWFRFLCAGRGQTAEAAFQALLADPAVPKPRPPFNTAARLAAGFSAAELAQLGG